MCNALWEAFLSLPSLLKFEVVSNNKINCRCCHDCCRDRNFSISATLVAAVASVRILSLKGVFPYIATVAETRFSTMAALVATGAIIWKPGLKHSVAFAIGNRC